MVKTMPVRSEQRHPSENCQTEELTVRYNPRSVHHQVPCQLQGHVPALRSELMRVPQVRLQEKETAMTTKSSEQAQRPSHLRCLEQRLGLRCRPGVSSQVLWQRMGPRG